MQRASVAALACWFLTAPISSAQNTLWQSYIEAGAKAYTQGRYSDAERLFKESLQAARTSGDKGIRLTRSLMNLGAVYKELAKYDQAHEMYREAISIIENGNKQQKADMAFTLNNIATIHEQQGHYAEAIELYKQSLDVAEKRFGPEATQTLLAINNLVNVYTTTGDYVEAMNLVKREIPIFEKNPKYRFELAVYLFHSARLADERGNFDKAEEIYKQAIWVGEKVIGPEHPHIATGKFALAQLHNKQGKYDEAEKLLKQSLQIREKAFSPTNPEVATVLNELATTYISQGRYAEAEPHSKRALDINEKILGLDHPAVADSLDVSAQIRQHNGDYSGADSIFKKALAIREKSLGASHPKVRHSLKNLGILYYDQGQYAVADQYFNKALAIADQEKATGRHPEIAEIMMALGRSYAKQNKLDEAIDLFKKASGDVEKTFGSETFQAADALRELAGLYLLKKDHQLAQQTYMQVLALDAKIAGPTSAKVAGDLEQLVKVYFAMGDQAKAKEISTRADDIKKNLPGSRFVAQAEQQSPAIASGAVAEQRPVGDKWALVVGISNFKDPSINLKFAAKDAIDFKNFLVNKAHFAPDHVKLLVDGDAKRENIVGQLGDQWLGRVANRDDLVVVYISSHGSSAQEQAGGVNFLVAHDTRKDSLLATGIPMQWLTGIVKDQVHSDRVVLILDVCHGGAAAGAGSKALVRTNGVDLDGLVLGTGQAVLCSSLADQLSWESKTYQNSVFTRRLIEALNSKGEKTTLSDAYSYLRDAVESEVLRDRGALQTPVLNQKLWSGGDAILTVTPKNPRPGLK